MTNQQDSELTEYSTEELNTPLPRSIFAKLTLSLFLSLPLGSCAYIDW